jgi:general secretion pathway protein K
MAIISTLWGIGLLAIVAVTLASNAAISYRLAANGFELATIRAAAEAGVNRAILSLTDARRERRWPTNGAAREFEFNAIRMQISVQDELGRIDLNQAGAPLLIGLLRSANLDAQAASSLTDKILDWRESGPGRHLNGAKEAQYSAAGRAYLPRNGPFQSVDELLLLIDMTPELFRRISPALTVYSGRPFIDPQVAPREALLALPNMDADKVNAAMAARLTRQGGEQSMSIDAISLQGRAFTIRVGIKRPSSMFVQEAAIRLTDNPAQPYWILSWKMQ